MKLRQDRKRLGGYLVWLARNLIVDDVEQFVRVTYQLGDRVRLGVTDDQGTSFLDCLRERVPRLSERAHLIGLMLRAAAPAYL